LLFAQVAVLCEGQTEPGALPRWWNNARTAGLPDLGAANVSFIGVDGHNGYRAYIKFFDAYLPRNGKLPASRSCSRNQLRFVPGKPVPPWPAATPGEDFMPPTGRGLTRLVNDEHTGRCPVCGRAWPRRIDGTLIAHAGRERSRWQDNTASTVLAAARR
jgi:hypothetical protein